jgi:hypothetical protein
MATKSDRERALDVAASWEREAYDCEQMAKSTSYTPLEARMLRQRATVRRACAQELKLEFATVSRG